MEVISSNVSNARTTDTGNGQPYRRLEAILKTEGDDELSPVKLDDIVHDNSEFYKVFNPGHPQADASGYVTMPNVVLPVEMMNLSVATRAYQANAAVLKRYQNMVDTTLELLR
jgi:flagellar basal-body rod protein FlgC